MAQSVTINGTTYSVPDVGDNSAWGSQLTAFFVALGSGTHQKDGSTYYKSRAANVASAGVLRIGNTETVGWRNNANDGDVALGVTTANKLTFDSLPVTGNPAAIYSTAAGQTFPGLTSIVNFGTSELDTDTAVTTGSSWKFTVPAAKSGLYRVDVAVTPSGAIASGTTLLALYKNGSAVRTLWKSAGAVPSTTMVRGTTTINLAVADYLDVRFSQSGGTISLTSTAQENYISITRQVG
jgi:hypothetical protein